MDLSYPGDRTNKLERLCKDCAHFIPEGDLCRKAWIVDPVHGGGDTQEARWFRVNEGVTFCGLEAKMFEAKP